MKQLLKSLRRNSGLPRLRHSRAIRELARALPPCVSWGLLYERTQRSIHGMFSRACWNRPFRCCGYPPIACVVSVTILPLARRATAVACCGVSGQSGVWGFVGLCRAMRHVSCESALPFTLKTRECIHTLTRPVSARKLAAFALPPEPHASGFISPAAAVRGLPPGPPAPPDGPALPAAATAPTCASACPWACSMATRVL